MQLTPFTTTTIINYNSILALRCSPCKQGDEQFISGRMLAMAERVLKNLQKDIVDSTISIAAGLEKGNSYSVTPQTFPYPNHQALPYYQSANVPFGYDGSESA
jgi:hypothetical protein